MIDHDNYEEMHELEGKLYLNMAACHLKLGNWQQAKIHCQMVTCFLFFFKSTRPDLCSLDCLVLF